MRRLRSHHRDPDSGTAVQVECIHLGDRDVEAPSQLPDNRSHD